MTRLVWQPEQPVVGVSQGVVYNPNGDGEVWNGLISVEESPSGGENSPRYIDGVKVQNKNRADDFALSIEAFTYPEWLTRSVIFGFSYKTGHKIHLVYNARAQLRNRTYQMQEHTPFSLDVSTRPVTIPGAARAAHLIIDTTKAYPNTVASFEALVYGSEESGPRFPSPIDVFNIFEENSILRVVDNGDGTFTVTGPDEAITVNPDGTFSITWPSAVYLDSQSYSIQSL